MQPQQEPSPPHSQNDDDDDDVIIVDPPQQQSGKRKFGDDQPSPRPPKRQPFWVEVPPRSKKRVSSAPVKTEESTPEVAIQVTLTAPAVKEESDQEVANALAVVRNVCLNLSPQNAARQFSSRP